MEDYMLTCDTPGCGAQYRHPSQEALRGTGSVGVLAARLLARADGWRSIPVVDADYCPTHSVVPKEVA